ncbi:MAG TPA: Stp1/IreP family PP2C-type Ser/Thr phosphatase [Rhodocyclaceae bacterium]|jgi:protein phosphatase|nr:Stp1/IreP family PP2C-type Ser/Thr phosphatase [Rhodocyclaceae bacterium]
MTERLHIEFCGQSDTGRVRSHNEDSIEIDPASGLAVLADGMGGYNAGEVASKLAVRSVGFLVRQRLARLEPAPPPDAAMPTPAGMLLKESVQLANQRILKTAGTRAEYRGMGTTVVAVLFRGDRVHVAHVGDSRLYRFRDDQLHRLTTDHSLQEELVARGMFSAEEVRRLGKSNVVTRALGVDAAVEVSVGEHEVRGGDLFLLCSDGLHDVLSEEDMLANLRRFMPDLPRLTRALVQAANARGGKDNISVILGRAEPIAAPRERTPWWQRRPWRIRPQNNN